MTTITLEFDAAGGLTITAAKLFAVGSDTQVDTAAATERTNAKGKYTAAYTDLAAGTYIVHAFDAAGLVALSDPITTLAVTGTYRAKTLDDVLTTQMTESYAADGVAPTPAQALLLIQQMLTEMVIIGTTMTIKKIDGSTTAATLTLNSATSPTSVTRAS